MTTEIAGILLGEPDLDDDAGWERYIAEEEEMAGIFARYVEAVHLWGRDPHEGEDGTRYGWTADKEFIDGPHFDPAFLEFLRELGEDDANALERGGRDVTL